MAVTIKEDRLASFNLFGYSILIWRKHKTKSLPGSGVGPNGSCKLVRYNDQIGLAMPDGTIIPHQTDLSVSAPLNAIATAKVELFITMD